MPLAGAMQLSANPEYNKVSENCRIFWLTSSLWREAKRRRMHRDAPRPHCRDWLDGRIGHPVRDPKGVSVIEMSREYWGTSV